MSYDPIKDTGLDKGYFGVGPWEANQILSFLPAVSKNIILHGFSTVPCRFGPICSARLPGEQAT
jgi:hypothetical protein